MYPCSRITYGPNFMTERRVDRIERLLRELNGRSRLQELLEAVRGEETNPELPYQSVYVAIQLENQRLDELGERTRFVTSREGESRGWVRLRETSDFAQGSAAHDLEVQIQEKNERVGDDIGSWLHRMDWRTFESTFLTRVLEALGFQDVQITQATRDGGVDARVTYRRGIVEARAIVSAKRWGSRTVPVEEVRMLRGLKGEEDTAIVVTTGHFSQDAQDEARPGQNQRIVYLIDGDKLIDVCKRQQIGVKKVHLPELLILDPEVTRDARNGESVEDDDSDSSGDQESDEPGLRRLRDEMLGDSQRGLSPEEVAQLSGYSLNTVRAYLGDERRRKVLGNTIRADEQARARALRMVSQRREAK
jgi:restriction endonuclease Mrr